VVWSSSHFAFSSCARIWATCANSPFSVASKKDVDFRNEEPI